MWRDILAYAVARVIAPCSEGSDDIKLGDISKLCIEAQALGGDGKALL